MWVGEPCWERQGSEGEAVVRGKEAGIHAELKDVFLTAHLFTHCLSVTYLIFAYDLFNIYLTLIYHLLISIIDLLYIYPSIKTLFTYHLSVHPSTSIIIIIYHHLSDVCLSLHSPSY